MPSQAKTPKGGARPSRRRRITKLSQLQDGAMVMFTQANSTVYVAPAAEPGGVINLVVTGKPPQGAISTFILTIQGTDGETTKALLQPEGMDGFYWVTGQNIVGLAYPIILGPSPETFILTGSIEGGEITIATAFSPPRPFIWGYNPATGARVLTYGHDQPFLIQGVFDLQVVG
jgi:hypothetical protein